MNSRIDMPKRLLSHILSRIGNCVVGFCSLNLRVWNHSVQVPRIMRDFYESCLIEIAMLLV